MVLHLEDEEWEYRAKGAAQIAFASVSTPKDRASLTVSLNGDEVECVHFSVPHSWWPNGGQPFCPPLVEGDVLAVAAKGSVALRLDLHEAG